jgi:hypothetical protein
MKKQVDSAKCSRAFDASLVRDMMFSYTTLLYVILNLETRAKRANRAAHNNHAPVEADITPKVEEVRADTANVKVGSKTAELLKLWIVRVLLT